MIHINPSNKDDSRILSPARVGGKRRTSDKPKQTPFYEQLSDTIEHVEKQNLDKAIDQIDRTGEKFLEDPSINNLGLYKKSVRQFLQLISRQAFRVKYIAGGRTNTYQIIETINKHLEELTQRIMNNENERLALLTKLGEIKALIIDLRT